MAGNDKPEDGFRDPARLRADQLAWLKGCQILAPGRDADGAIRNYPDQGAVNPYFANFAALALLEDPASAPLARRYLDWYGRHIEDDGTIRDHEYGPGGASTSPPDSEDAYAGTFLSLAARYHQICPEDPWVRDNLPVLRKVAGVVTRLMDADGLTIAMATRKVKYLMDNCESYRGLADFAGLVPGDEAPYFRGRARLIRDGVERVLWNPRRGVYLPSKGGWSLFRTNWGRFYPDAACQAFPSLYGLIDPSSPRAFRLYRDFNRHQPGWTRIQPPDFPWVILAYWAARQGAWAAVREKLFQVQHAYIDAGAGSWLCAEAAFFILACSRLLGASPPQNIGPGRSNKEFFPARAKNIGGDFTPKEMIICRGRSSPSWTRPFP